MRPINEGARPLQRGQPLAHLPRDIARAGVSGQFQAKPPLGGSVALADLDQQLGQARGPQPLEVLRVQRRLRGHMGRSAPEGFLLGQLTMPTLNT